MRRSSLGSAASNSAHTWETENWSGKRWTLPASSAWDASSKATRKGLRDPSEERPLSAAAITCLGISENPEEALKRHAPTFRAHLEF